MMKDKKNIIGEVSVEVKAGLSVDERTFRTCMNLAAIHAQNEGFKGMVVKFNDDDIDGYGIRPLMTDDDVRAAMCSTPDIIKEE